REALEALLQMAEVLVQQGTPTDHGASERQPEVGRVAHQLADLTRAVLGCQRVSVIAFASKTGQLRPLALVGFPPTIEADWFQTVAHFTLPEHFTGPIIQRLEAGEVVVADLTHLERPGLPTSRGQQTLVAPMRLGQHLLGILMLDYGSASHRYTPTEHTLAGAVAKLAALILERERLFSEREEARASALAERETARQMSDFLSLIGHELKTPLTSLKGQAQLAQRQMARLLATEDALPGTTAEMPTTRL